MKRLGLLTLLFSFVALSGLNAVTENTANYFSPSDLVVSGGEPASKGAIEAGFKVEGQLAQIFADKKLFAGWIKGNQSLTRVGNPLNATEAQQLITNAKNLGLPLENNMAGLMGKEVTGQWAGVPHFKIGNVHIPIAGGLEDVLKF